MFDMAVQTLRGVVETVKTDAEYGRMSIACLIWSLVQTLGGVVETVETDGEYGRTSIRTTQASELYREEADHAQQVWMSHGDKAVQLPDGFQPVATSEKVSSAATHAW